MFLKVLVLIKGTSILKGSLAHNSLLGSQTVIMSKLQCHRHIRGQQVDRDSNVVTFVYTENQKILQYIPSLSVNMI